MCQYVFALYILFSAWFAFSDDEACTRITQQEERKRQTKAAKVQRNKGKQPTRRQTSKRVVTEEERDENKCQGCGGKFEEDSDDRQEDWVGCELCWRWYHYDCACLPDLPEEEDPWTCPKCTYLGRMHLEVEIGIALPLHETTR